MTSEYKSNEHEDKLKSFLAGLKASYSGFGSQDPQDQDDEAAASEKHNDAMRQLFDVCRQIQCSDTEPVQY